MAVLAALSAPVLGTLATPASAATTETIYVANTGSITSFPETATGNVAPSTTLADGIGDPEGLAYNNGDVWVANDHAILEYTASQLSSTGSPTPIETILPGPGNDISWATGLAFDASGNMWVTSRMSNTVIEYTASQLAAGGALTPNTTLSYSGTNDLSEPSGLAFDASGDLWVASETGNTVAEFPQSDLTTTGDTTPTPSVVISGTHVDQPWQLEFSGSNLWVSNTGAQSANGSMLEYLSGQLLTTGSPTPTVVLTVSGNALSYVHGFAFDTSGDLWVADAENCEVLEYQPAQLTTGSPTPTVDANGQCPTALLAQPAGAGLWGTDLSIGAVFDYTASQLATSGNQPAAALVTSPVFLYGPESLAVDASGDLWASGGGRQGYVAVEYTAAELASGAVSPSVTLWSVEANSLAFDSQGDLWASNDTYTNEYAASALSATGTPSATVTDDYGTNDRGRAFDESGDLWTVNYGTGLAELTPAQLAVGGTTPHAVITSVPAMNAWAVAFDSSGDLWAATTMDTLVEFTPSQLAAAGNISPTVTISASSGSINGPSALAFDPNGNLWVANSPSIGALPSLVEFSSSELATTGSPTPLATISGTATGLCEPYALVVVTQTISGGSPATTTTSTTTTTTPTTTTTVAPPPAAPKPVLSLMTSKATVKANVVVLRFRCSRATCHGVLRLWHGSVLLGSQAYSIAPGTGTVAVHLSPRAMKLLKAAKHHVISAVQAATVAGGAKAKGPVRLVG